MLEQQQTIITRKARIWPEMSEARIDLPVPPTHIATTNPFMLISLGSSAVGMGLYVIYTLHISGGNSGFALSLLFMSGTMLLGTTLSFFLQWVPARHRQRRAYHLYQHKLTEARQLLIQLERQERQGRVELDPPLLPPAGGTPGYERLAIVPILQRSYDNQDVDLWARRPDDPDFLLVRLGMGTCTPRFTVQQPQQGVLPYCGRTLAALLEEAEMLVKRFASLIAPITVPLKRYSTVALLAVEQRLEQARMLAQVMLVHLAYHHSPEDVRVVILAPESRRVAWEWTGLLPHTIVYDPRLSAEESHPGNHMHAVAIGNEAVLRQLPLISREVSRRELLLGDAQGAHPQQRRSMLPHLVIVVDHFDEIDDLDPLTQHLPAITTHAAHQPGGAKTAVLNRPRLSVSPLHRPELALALNAAPSSGVTVLAICQRPADIPATAGLLIDLLEKGREQGESRLQAHIRSLQPAASASLLCAWLDEVSYEALYSFAARLHMLRPLSTRRLELRTQVDLCALYDPPLDLATYDPYLFWNDPTLRLPNGAPAMRVPIGMKIGDEIQYLDLLKDGPHGLLIGQTGSGKSELLQTIITALAVAYRPDEVNFLLIDYKAGLALEAFSRLPHTVGFLSNVSSPALIQRFMTMLRAEATRREIALKEGKVLPRLLIIIDEFTELVKRTEHVLEELFTITRVGREIGMHLLLAAQRPEGIIGSHVRDYVQYRLCLRCASPEDSREVLRRVDAAALPASIPGRGYLLHGDNQLDLFQAARVSIPVAPVAWPDGRAS